MNDRIRTTEWQDVLEFWFPEGGALDIDRKTHRGHWAWRMRGGADDEIVERFGDMTRQAADGELHRWASDPQGRLALIILLDQFSRSLWRGAARAFAQDEAALALTREGLSNGHYAALDAPWLKIVFGLPLGHCEGPDHLRRIDRLIGLREEIAAAAPVHLRPVYESLVKQAHDVRQVIAAFGRHPHRNDVLDRQSTAAEKTYIEEGSFPHLRAFQGEA